MLGAPTIAHDFPWVSSSIGLVHDQAAGRAQFGCFFEFIGPASVVRHGLSAKGFGIELARILRIGHRRIVDQHNQDFPAHVHAFEVIPLKFGRLHPVTGKDHAGIDCALVRHALRPGDEVTLKFRRKGMAMALKAELHLRIRGDSDEAHTLQVGTIGIAGFEACAAELVLQILNREVFAFRSRTASFELVGGKRANVGQDAIAGK